MEKLSPMITIDYQEYLRLQEDIQDAINTFNKLLEITNEEKTKDEIINYMTRSGRWV